MKKITPEELSLKLATDQAIVLDVRAKEKFEKNSLTHKNVENIHVFKTVVFDALEKDKELSPILPKDREIIVTCTTGNSAGKCTKILADKGYQVTLLEGGITAWEAFQNDKKAER